MANIVSILVGLCIMFHYGWCDCDCERFRELSGYYGASINISLERSRTLCVEAYRIDMYDCESLEAHWEIVRADGVIETYTVVDYTENRHGRNKDFPKRGLLTSTSCHGFCYLYLSIAPTDLRYNEARITCVFNLPECYNTSNATEVTTLRIQGLLEPPTGVVIETLSVDRVLVSWDAPFTLQGIPILQYSVFITSEGISEQRNTTETNITLGRPQASTIYHISAWNEVGEGNASQVLVTMSDATVRSIENMFMSGICLSCTFFADSTADGCTAHLQNDMDSFVFDIIRYTNDVLNCFLVHQAGEYSVFVYEIQQGVLQESTMRYLENVTVPTAEYSSLVKPVIGGICVSCVFSSYSTASGCTVLLYNDDHTLNFNASRQSPEDIALLECFEMSQVGLFHVEVSVVRQDTLEKQTPLQLPDITTVPTPENSEKSVNDSSAVTGLSIVVVLTVIGVIIASIILIVYFIRRSLKKTQSPTNPNDSQETPAMTTHAPALYEPVQQQTSATGEDCMYETVEMKPVGGKKDIEVAPNVAYGPIQR